MPLKSIALTKTEAKSQFESPEEDKGPKFPFGSSLHLEEAVLDKLDIEKMPEVGDKMSLVAVVKVESVTESEQRGGKKRRSLSLQITNMALTDHDDPKEAVDVLYGPEKKGDKESTS